MSMSVPQDTALQLDGHLHDARQVRIVEGVGVAEQFVGHEFDVFAAERMRVRRS